jgi:hypothetical protein
VFIGKDASVGFGFLEVNGGDWQIALAMDWRTSL